ncbi:unnamed protein product, partial [Mesorhabditis spiculigera]
MLAAFDEFEAEPLHIIFRRFVEQVEAQIPANTPTPAWIRFNVRREGPMRILHFVWRMANPAATIGEQAWVRLLRQAAVPDRADGRYGRRTLVWARGSFEV